MIPIRAFFAPAVVAGMIALLFSMPFEACAQSNAPPIPAGLVYQAAVESGMGYVNPTTGQAIINQKATVNIKAFIAKAAADGSIDALGAGVAGIIKMGVKLETGLAAGHVFADKELVPVLTAAAPNPNDLPPVLQMTASMTPSAAACAENTIYVPRAKSFGPVTINGYAVTFSYQGEQVLKHVDGSHLKQFQAVDVLACVPGTIVFPAAPAPAAAPAVKPASLGADEGPPVWYLAAGLRQAAAESWNAR